MPEQTDRNNLKVLPELFDQLYRDNLDLVYKLALGLTGNIADAEEVTQEAFLKAFRSYHTFREECAFSTWIYRIAINVSKDYLRQRAKLPVPALTEDLGYLLEEVLDPNPDNNPETALLANLARDKCLHSLTECLPLEQRKVFCLAITLGLPHKLVAEILECSVASVKTSLHRAKARWFGYMDDRCQLINKSGSCSCKQWVRFGVSQGWFSAEAAAASSSADMVQVKEDIGAMKALRVIYQSSCRKNADETYVKRIREGIESKEWGIFC
ncbi:RNA polymerase sigma factor [Citrifermentans bemidjiense Bem]|uniref:RNA polymerase sigma factor n=1 Tax=Citrifermentans bemidjiense (strain ATCC BAA-1014 / DSM 16622 / JCM 12645 / Bem) TaxID=404380 RepID=B5E906_CITBB|nr:RNA polymerase sigma factor [Citrifermentans bemidjiense]ACH40170.2 RNA polymerase sigma factor [Citrifermentans bemidjiense Bem]